MSVQDRDPPAAPVASREQDGRAALERYRRRMRPWRIGYAAGIAAVVVALVVVVVVAWNHGEISHVTLKTVPSAPASVALRPPSTAQQLAWRSADTTAIGTPYWQGTIVTHDVHTVRGRDARTGAQTWSYTRTDRTVCTAIQDGGVTVAVYRLHGNCDQLTALDSGTGARRWTRTLDKDGAEFNGPATYSVQSGSIMFVSAHAIYDVATSGTADQGNGGLDFWVFREQGCTIGSAVLGSTGALISQTCSGRHCTDLKFCGNGHQLLLRDASAGENTDSSKNHGNPDQIIWNKIGVDLVPVSAGQVIAARTPDGRTLEVLGSQKPTVSARLPIAAGTATATTSAADADLIWSGGTTYALTSGASHYSWRAPSAGPPTITGDSSSPAILSRARIAVPTKTGVALLDGNTGRVRTSRPLDQPPPRGSRAFPFGTGFVIAGASTAVYR